MKKVMFFVMVAVMPFISCSSDDVVGEIEDAIQNPKEDPIIGEWFLTGKKHVIDGTEKTIPLTACDKLNKFVIKDDGILMYSSYYRNGDDCELEGNEEVFWNPKTFEDKTYSFRYMEEADGISSVVKLDGKTITETYSYPSGDSTIEVVNVYSTTADESGDDQGAEQYLVIGKWSESKTTTAYYENGEFFEAIEDIATMYDFIEVEFKADGTFREFVSDSYMSNGDFSEEIVETSTSEGTYEVKANKIIFTYPPFEEGEPEESFEWQYTQSGNLLTLNRIEENTSNGIVYKEDTTMELYR